jgi:hypothetical protein
LQYIRQESGETLRDYLERYHVEVIDMGVFNEKETLTNFWENLRTGALWESFEEKHLETYMDTYTPGRSSRCKKMRSTESSGRWRRHTRSTEGNECFAKREKGEPTRVHLHPPC